VRLLRPDEPPLDEPLFIPGLLEDQIDYLPTAPWPTAPAGSGHSLNRIDPNSSGNEPTNWTSSLASPGTLPDVTPPRIAGVFVLGSRWSPQYVGQFPPAGLAIGEGAAQLEAVSLHGVDQIRLQFTEPVQVDSDDLQLFGVNAGYSIVNFAYDPATLLATWQLEEPLRTDKLLVALDDAVTDLRGNRLDGDWNNGGDTFPSGDGSSGTEDRFLFRINVLVGDTLADGVVDRQDAAALVAALAATPGTARYNPRADLDGSGRINMSALRSLFAMLGSQLPAAEPDESDPGEQLIATDSVFQRLGGGQASFLSTRSLERIAPASTAPEDLLLNPTKPSAQQDLEPNPLASSLARRVRRLDARAGDTFWESLEGA